MPLLAAFPKAFMDELCVNGSMSIRDWVELAAPLGIEGLEFYSGFLELREGSGWPTARREVEQTGMTIPMLCCSPDFTHPDSDFRRRQVEHEKQWIDMAAALGAKYCRVLSGQRRPEVSRATGSVMPRSASKPASHTRSESA